jgi:hypothetical protein
VTKIMSGRRCLYHDMIKTTKITKQIVILRAEQSYGNRSSDCRHLDRVAEAVVHYSTRRHRGDHLRDIGQP